MKLIGALAQRPHNILLLSSAYNGLTQRLHTHLMDRGHRIQFRLALSEDSIQRDVDAVKPEFVLCPFLTRRIPPAVCASQPCLVLHPGVVADGGPSSLDWAVLRREAEWGVTLLQADKELDGGPVWSHRDFHVPEGSSKASLYRGPVTDAAVECVDEFLVKFRSGARTPKRPGEMQKATARGEWRDRMEASERTVDWRTDDTETVLRKVRCSDSTPGALGSLLGRRLRLFGAHREEGEELRGEPGRLLATRDGAVCVGAGNGAVWISHARVEGGVKLPTASVLAEEISAAGVEEVPYSPFSSDHRATFREIWYEQVEHVGILNFNFHNGAMSTDQCRRLTEAYREAKQLDAKVLILQGNGDFFSNGIHLNVIEAAPRPEQEAWSNICAIDDLVREVLINTRQVTVSAVQANAGAGGVFLALAADHVWLRRGCVLNPHYRTMGLFGSEYWTYSLPRRLQSSATAAEQLVNACLPISAERAWWLGLADRVIPGHFPSGVRHQAKGLLTGPQETEDFLRAKAARLAADRPVMEECRARELSHMRQDMFERAEFHAARRAFVRRARAKTTPERLLDPQGSVRGGDDDASSSSCSLLTRSIVSDPVVEETHSAMSKSRILKGKDRAAQIAHRLVQAITKQKQRQPDFEPTLAIVQVGDRPDSNLYIRQKTRLAKKIGVRVEHIRLPRTTSYLEVLGHILKLNESDSVNGIVLQLPLDSNQSSINVDRLLDAIDPKKDVDGLGSTNRRLLQQGNLDEAFISCAPLASLELVKMSGVPVKDVVAVVIGNSNMVGKPTAMLLSMLGAQVVRCDVDTIDTQKLAAGAQIVVAAAGVAKLVRQDWVRKGALVIDCGCSTNPDGQGLVGDVYFQEVAHRTSYISPVPGGVGPLAVAMLMSNVVQAALKKVHYQSSGSGASVRDVENTVAPRW
ncbi:hypothetical protein BOX15_Mlig028590g1 [Macrostomum lignano]|uniref:methenyltetrahydrofolate cyclohydrolase n=1 Tax=Macrostomum lignano TaxID=282301 RepID=A0A267ECK2_9PLAT|nr:hypothetical protein BOX15_Mlig028590g1 [Macrostomum lignano]